MCLSFQRKIVNYSALIINIFFSVSENAAVLEGTSGSSTGVPMTTGECVRNDSWPYSGPGCPAPHVFVVWSQPSASVSLASIPPSKTTGIPTSLKIL